MNATARKAVIIGVPAFVAAVVTLVLTRLPPADRLTALLLISATTVLTLSSVAGYALLKIYAGQALAFGVALRGRVIALVLAVIAFAVSLGSGALLSYILRRI